MLATGLREGPHLGEFGDERLDRVGRDLLSAMVTKRTVNVRRMAGKRSQELRFGRFLHNESVTAEGHVAPRHVFGPVVGRQDMRSPPGRVRDGSFRESRAFDGKVRPTGSDHALVLERNGDVKEPFRVAEGIPVDASIPALRALLRPP